MNKQVLSFGLLFVIMWLVQVLLFNHLVLFHLAVPVVFIYFIIRLPIGFNKNLLLTLSFLLGLAIDIASDTAGINALACTIFAVLKKPVFFSYVQKDDKTAHIIPSISTMGMGAYCKYLLTMSAIYCLLLFSIEYFSVADIRQVLLMAAASCLYSFLLMLSIDSLMITRREKRL